MKQRAVEKYYSVSELAFLLSFSPAWVRGHLGDFPGTVKIDDDFRIPASGINAWLSRHELMAVGEALERVGIPARSETELKRKVRGNVR